MIRDQNVFICSTISEVFYQKYWEVVKNTRKSRPGEIPFYRNVRSWDVQTFRFFGNVRKRIYFTKIIVSVLYAMNFLYDLSNFNRFFWNKRTLCVYMTQQKTSWNLLIVRLYVIATWADLIIFYRPLRRLRTPFKQIRLYLNM